MSGTDVVRSYSEFLERYMPEEARRRRHEQMTPEEIGRELAREALDGIGIKRESA